MRAFWQVLVWGALAGLIIGSAAMFRAHAQTPTAQVNICYQLRHGANIVDIETRLLTAGYSAHDAGVLAARELQDHCPDQLPNVARQVGYE